MMETKPSRDENILYRYFSNRALINLPFRNLNSRLSAFPHPLKYGIMSDRRFIWTKLSFVCVLLIERCAFQPLSSHLSL